MPIGMHIFKSIKSYEQYKNTKLMLVTQKNCTYQFNYLIYNIIRYKISLRQLSTYLHRSILKFSYLLWRTKIVLITHLHPTC